MVLMGAYNPVVAANWLSTQKRRTNRLTLLAKKEPQGSPAAHACNRFEPEPKNGVGYKSAQVDLVCYSSSNEKTSSVPKLFPA